MKVGVNDILFGCPLFVLFDFLNSQCNMASSVLPIYLSPSVLFLSTKDSFDFEMM